MSLGNNTWSNRKAVEEQLEAGIAQPGKGYRSYVATLTQTGTADPVATIIHNDFDTAPTWTRVNTGRYETADDFFGDGSNAQLITQYNFSYDYGDLLYGGMSGGNIQLYTVRNTTLVPTDNGMDGYVCVEVRVYE